MMMGGWDIIDPQSVETAKSELSLDRGSSVPSHKMCIHCAKSGDYDYNWLNCEISIKLPYRLLYNHISKPGLINPGLLVDDH
jgi:hypothetical protein